MSRPAFCLHRDVRTVFWLGVAVEYNFLRRSRCMRVVHPCERYLEDHGTQNIIEHNSSTLDLFTSASSRR